jgi:hypothetical protein
MRRQEQLRGGERGGGAAGWGALVRGSVLLPHRACCPAGRSCRPTRWATAPCGPRSCRRPTARPPAPAARTRSGATARGGAPLAGCRGAPAATAPRGTPPPSAWGSAGRTWDRGEREGARGVSARGPAGLHGTGALHARDSVRCLHVRRPTCAPPLPSHSCPTPSCTHPRKEAPLAAHACGAAERVGPKPREDRAHHLIREHALDEGEFVVVLGERRRRREEEG